MPLSQLLLALSLCWLSARSRYWMPAHTRNVRREDHAGRRYTWDNVEHVFRNNWASAVLSLYAATCPISLSTTIAKMLPSAHELCSQLVSLSSTSFQKKTSCTSPLTPFSIRLLTCLCRTRKNYHTDRYSLRKVEQWNSALLRCHSLVPPRIGKLRKRFPFLTNFYKGFLKKVENIKKLESYCIPKRQIGRSSNLHRPKIRGPCTTHWCTDVNNVKNSTSLSILDILAGMPRNLFSCVTSCVQPFLARSSSVLFVYNFILIFSYMSINAPSSGRKLTTNHLQ